MGFGYNVGGVALELGEVVERTDPIELAGVDQAHLEVADGGPVLRFIEERIFTVEDRFFQRPFAEVVVQESAGDA
jgi:hypothetical protein